MAYLPTPSMKSEPLKFNVCVVGFKGCVFCEGLLRRGLPPGQIISYRPLDDRAKGFERLQSIAQSTGIKFVETKAPMLDADVLTFFVGWQYLLKDLSRSVVVFHDSLLPRFRGFAPNVNALLNGESKIGVTALYPGPEADSGPIIAQSEVSITFPIRIQSALTLQAEAMVDLACAIVKQSQSGKLPCRLQEEAQATYSLWRDDQDYNIDWSQSSDEIRRLVDAVSYPYSGARTRLGSEPVVVDEATELGDLKFERRDIGKVCRLDEGRPIVVCGAGLLRLDRLIDSNGEIYKPSRLRIRAE
jgi:methionyl-tRNA formyltransferase